jgi:hypothetical protein
MPCGACVSASTTALIGLPSAGTRKDHNGPVQCF